jgi:serine/threonine protein kinase
VLANPAANGAQERIGRYEVLRKIATGGMAELFIAKQVGMEGFEKVVAIKRILAHLAYDEEFINMFRDEARIVAKLSHPNIVQIYDLGKHDDTYFIAMEYIPGRNLSSVAKKAKQRGEPMPPEYVARCIAQASEGLYYAHTRKDIDGRPLKIVHRDVSPQNIIVSFSGTVKLVDFGIAKAATKIAHTRAGVLKGKYAYMSPEQIRGEDTDARSDLFAVGVVLYELLCGRRPFEKDNSIQTLKAIVQEPHVDCREYNPAIPDTLAEIIDRALEKDPRRRYQDAQEVQVALEDFVSASAIRCNNITISKWVTDLFAEELSKDKGGTIVFQGIGEVILPDVLDRDAPVEPARSEPRPAPRDPSGSAAALEQPLQRGRGGGSIEQRAPIPAPSNRLVGRPESVFSGQTGHLRSNLIEEGIIERPGDARASYDDDSTVHAEGKASPSPSAEAPSAPARPKYDDGATEFAAKAPEERSSDLNAPEAGTISFRRGATPPPSAPGRAGGDDERSGEPVDTGLHAADEDPWDDATIGYPGGVPPEDEGEAFGAEEDEPTAAPGPARKRPGPVTSGDTISVVAPSPEDNDLEPWGELADDASAGLGVASNAQPWDDQTTTNDAFSASPEPIPTPLVSDFDDADEHVVALDDGEAQDATVTLSAVRRDASPLGDATLSMSSNDVGAAMDLGDDDGLAFDADLEDADFESDATVGADQLEQASAILRARRRSAGEHVDPELVRPGAALPASDPSWSRDATVAGMSVSFDALAEPDSGEEPAELNTGQAEPPELSGGIALDFDGVDMDEEPALPVPRREHAKWADDARTMAGVTSDYVMAGVAPPESGTYDLLEEARAPEPPAAMGGMPSPPPRRGEQRLGAIKLSRVAVPVDDADAAPSSRPEARAPSSFETLEEVEDQPEAMSPRRPPALPSSAFEASLDPDFDLDSAPVAPSALDEPEEERRPGATAAPAEALGSLLPPRPPPLSFGNALGGIAAGAAPSGPMGIGSTNVPPASLSLSQVLTNPPRSGRSGLMAIPRGAMPNAPTPVTDGPRMRGASGIGRQIREVVRSEGPSPVRPLEVSAPPRPESVEGPKTSADASRPARGRRWLWGGLGALVLVGLTAVAYLAMPLLLGRGGPQLSLKSTPAGAKVYVDGALQSGLTPLTLSGLSPKVTYDVRLEKDGFLPVTKSVTLDDSKKVLVVPITLQPALPAGEAAPPGKGVAPKSAAERAAPGSP